MRIGRITKLSDEPPPRPPIKVGIDLQALQQKNLARQYAQGLEDGTLITLDMIEGKATHGGVPYDGPLPDELREWIANVRKNAKT